MKEINSNGFINYMAADKTPLDEISLVQTATMYKVHIAFLMSEKY